MSEGQTRARELFTADVRQVVDQAMERKFHRSGMLVGSRLDR